MSIVIIGLVLVIIHIFSGFWPRFRVGLYRRYFQFALGQRASTLRLLAALLVPLLTVAALQIYLLGLGPTWPWFLFSLFMVLITWGSRDLDQDISAYLHADSESERRRAAEVLIATYRRPMEGEGTDSVVRGVFYQALVRWFGTLFWFLVLGATGALAFRLPHVLLSEAANRRLLSGRQLAVMKRVAGLVDLVPAILATFSLAVVGHFDAVIEAWRNWHRDRQPLHWDYEILPNVGQAVVTSPDHGDASFEGSYQNEVQAARSLVWRALIAWLSVVALLVLGGLVS